MNLEKLFQAQKKLDDHIEKSKGLEGQNLLDKKILALQVELGELANEWRGFKYWSENQEPRMWYVCELCEGSKEISATTDTGSVGETYEVYDVYDVDVECPLCEGYDDDRNPLLEEYVDGLHFILSIGNDLGITHEDICIEDDLTGKDATETFNLLFCYVTEFLNELNTDYPSTLETREYLERAYHDIFECFVGLGESQLGFTWEEVEAAYFEKNKINYERQENGY